MYRWMALGLLVVAGACGGQEPQDPIATGDDAIYENECWDCYCPEPEPEYECETAFAWGGECDEYEPPCGPTANVVPPPNNDVCHQPETYCFDEVDESISRWGWTNYIEAGLFTAPPYPSDVIELPLLVGAAHCNTDALQVGVVRVQRFNQARLGVRFVAFPGYDIDESHLYLGDDPLPLNKKGKATVAPGQFPYSDGPLHLYGIQTTLPSYLIAHAVVCWPIEDEVNGADTCE